MDQGSSGDGMKTSEQPTSRDRTLLLGRNQSIRAGPRIYRESANHDSSATMQHLAKQAQYLAAGH